MKTDAPPTPLLHKAVPFPDKPGSHVSKNCHSLPPRFTGEGDRQARSRAQGVVGVLAFLRILALILFASLQLAAAIAPHEAMGNPAQERRARALYSEVRCVVCQNESIADSTADIAADLRADIRSQIASGRSDSEIRDTLVARYGDFVLFRPRLTPASLILWASPFLVLLLGGVAFRSLTRQAATDLPEDAAPMALDESEAARLRQRLDDPTSITED